LVDGVPLDALVAAAERDELVAEAVFAAATAEVAVLDVAAELAEDAWLEAPAGVVATLVSAP
jgi:hypothetical protein